jgi:hypothetical protein
MLAAVAAAQKVQAQLVGLVGQVVVVRVDLLAQAVQVQTLQ